MKNLYISIIILIIFGLAFWLLKDNNIENKNMSEEKVVEQEIINVTMNTNLGEIKLEMYPSEAPKTVESFVKLSKDGFYNGTKFHRIINDFMIQGGDPLSKEEENRQYWGTGGPGYSFEDEPNNVDLVKGVIAMANSGPNTNGSQFFIITAEETPWLQGKHTGFGKVISGMDIIEKIENTEVGPTDQPLEDIVLESVKIIE
jgi:cyclophilin family peptidyl-prolyl cis-trans isomerase